MAWQPGLWKQEFNFTDDWSPCLHGVALPPKSFKFMIGFMTASDLTARLHLKKNIYQEDGLT